MANWEKLNNELGVLLNTLSDQDWKSWMEKKAVKKAMRRELFELTAKIHNAQLALNIKEGLSQELDISTTTRTTKSKINFDHSTMQMIKKIYIEDVFILIPLAA
ncbi:hypothetical protein ACFQ3S_18000 [Mucilaginibacter terrae]|uniref:hypothetical protein n=1 Tax=Mucilaginibacter terrae TaxID=1955052 RepID=UPI00362B820E